MPTFARFAFNFLLLLAGASILAVRSTRGAYWGPEGPVGGGLLAIPPVFLIGGVLAALVVMGQFDWIPGGRLVAFVLYIGFLIALGAASWFLMDEIKGNWHALAEAAPWVIVAGCFLAVNLGPKALIAITLGSTAVAGFVLAGAGFVQHVEAQNQMVEAQIRHDEAFEQQRIAEFRALGTEAPISDYFSYMYMPEEALRKECRDIMAHRSDLNVSLIEYLGSPMLAPYAVHYIGDVAEHPAAELAPAFAAHSDEMLKDYREMLTGKTVLSDRAQEDIRALFAAAGRLQASGANLTPQMTAWRDYLRGFSNAGEFVK